MTLAVFFGCTFIAFGPAFGLFIFTIARDPLRIIILIAGHISTRTSAVVGSLESPVLVLVLLNDRSTNIVSLTVTTHHRQELIQNQ
ncbi:hypothetical protein HGM15179_014522 [Zosterops borbonicus]|uniref:Gamma-secretase subunit APH-1 n=1 Tax=Zosterops borbonicus TaxID=364589 RepID=A0A8K1G649_9PASS|nr:hypothetical protein HGM15179_014522 [Zosterops borbonicus]